MTVRKDRCEEKLQEYALSTEIVGGIAIVLSLIFVGLQIIRNSELMQAQTRDFLSGKQIKLYMEMGLNWQAMAV